MLTWIDLQASVLTYESILEQLDGLTNLNINGFANVTKGESHNSNFSRSIAQRGSRGSRRRGRNDKNSKPICQVYNKPGHIVANCYYGFDRSYGQGEHNRKIDGYANSAHIITCDDSDDIDA